MMLPQEQLSPHGAGLSEACLGGRANNTTTRVNPEAGSIRARILEALQAGEHLTSLTAWQRWGNSRLAADIHQLRKMGWPILSHEATVTVREGRTAHVARYSLPQGGCNG
jgi:hypothetical protein